jgi:hypothetical protein
MLMFRLLLLIFDSNTRTTAERRQYFIIGCLGINNVVMEEMDRCEMAAALKAIDAVFLLRCCRHTLERLGLDT